MNRVRLAGEPTILRAEFQVATPLGEVYNAHVGEAVTVEVDRRVNVRLSNAREVEGVRFECTVAVAGQQSGVVGCGEVGHQVGISIGVEVEGDQAHDRSINRDEGGRGERAVAITGENGEACRVVGGGHDI